MKKVPWSLAGRLLARDWRSGEVVVLFAALTVAVAAMSAVTFFTDRVGRAVEQQAGESLAADLRVRSIDPLPVRFDDLARAHSLKTARVVHFRSVVVAGDASSLADVRGVSGTYPLRGEVRIADRLGGMPVTARDMPARGTAWAEPRLLARLGLKVGDSISVGKLSLRVTHTLEYRPDQGWRLMQLAPTLLLNLDDVFASGLLQPGSVAQYEALYAGDNGADVTAFRAALERQLRPGEELQDIRDARPEVRSTVENARRFLILSALVSVLLGGVAVAMSARRFVSRRLDAVALMKCLGAHQRDVLRLSLTQLLILVIAAGAAGSVIGFAAQSGLTWLLADFIQARLPSAGARGGALGPLTALVVALGFALPPLLRLGGVPPARVLRQDLDPPPLRYLAIYGVATAAVTGILYVLFGDLKLIVYLLAGAVVTLAVLYGAGRVLVLALQRLRGGVGIAWRYGIANVARRGRESSVQVVAFGLGLMVLLLLTLVRGQLMAEWQGRLPTKAPNRFLINVQANERAGIAALIASHGIARPKFTPLARARISRINGQPIGEYRARDRHARRELNRALNLTWADEPNRGNRIVAGTWWKSADKRPQLSIEEGRIKEMGLALGDRLTLTLGGEQSTVEITSVRHVQWDSFRPNFFMVVNPAAFEKYPHTYITSFYTSPEQRSVGLDLLRKFSDVSIIDIDAVLDEVRTAMNRAALAVEYVFAFTLAAGLMVLLAAIQATRDERMFESAVLRTLGAKRSVVLQGVAAEFTALGLLAGTLAAIGATLIGYVIATRLFDLSYTPSLVVWLVGLIAGALVVGISGTLAVRSVVNESPVVTLRNA